MCLSSSLTVCYLCLVTGFEEAKSWSWHGVGLAPTTDNLGTWFGHFNTNCVYLATALHIILPPWSLDLLLGQEPDKPPSGWMTRLLPYLGWTTGPHCSYSPASVSYCSSSLPVLFHPSQRYSFLSLLVGWDVEVSRFLYQYQKQKNVEVSWF